MSITRVPYDAVQDIPNLDKKILSSRKADLQIRELLQSTRFVLKHPSNLTRASVYKLPICEVVTNQLYMFSITHYSIRVLVATAVRREHYPLVADALSLAREQVEKVFIVASLLSNPNTAFKQYWRNSWKVEFEKYQLDREEHKENDRFDEFLKISTPKRLERMRRDPVLKNILVSRYAERVLTYYWNNPYGKSPSWFKTPKNKNKPKSVFNYVRDYFDFATPGRGLRNFKDVKLRRFLSRWHKEYGSLSQYTHITMRKIAFAEMLKAKDMGSQPRIREFAIEHAMRAINTSYTAAASACLLVVNEVSRDYGTKIQTKELWETLIDFSLFSKALWKMYAEEALNAQLRR
jgi:hypothetical protein